MLPKLLIIKFGEKCLPQGESKAGRGRGHISVRCVQAASGQGAGALRPQGPCRAGQGHAHSARSTELHSAPVILRSLAASCLVFVTSQYHQVPWGLLEVQIFRPSRQNLLTRPSGEVLILQVNAKSHILNNQRAFSSVVDRGKLSVDHSFLLCFSDVTS